jgi:hypothetical protein
MLFLVRADHAKNVLPAYSPLILLVYAYTKRHENETTTMFSVSPVISHPVGPTLFQPQLSKYFPTLGSLR